MGSWKEHDNMDKSSDFFSKFNEHIRNKQAFYQGLLLSGASRDGNRERVACMGSVCTDRSRIPPTIIYKAQPGALMDYIISI
jgi:hypothetical protein